MFGGDIGCWIVVGPVFCRAAASRVELRNGPLWKGIFGVLPFSVDKEDDNGDDAEEYTCIDRATYYSAKTQFRSTKRY